MNSRFDKYRKIIDSGDTVEIEKTLNELHKSFATLSQEEQKYANIFIHDIQNGDIQVDSSKTFREYVALYQANAENSQIMKLVELFGLDNEKLKEMINLNVTESNINDYGRFDDLKNSVDKEKAKAYFEEIEGCTLPLPKVNIKVHNLLKDFILKGGYEIKS
jgi:type I restriction enzyme R subunit